MITETYTLDKQFPVTRCTKRLNFLILVLYKYDKSFQSLGSVPSTANIQMFRAKRHQLPPAVKSDGD